MKNYKTIAQEWAMTKAAILAEHNRVNPLIRQIAAELTAISGQRIGTASIEVVPGLAFYPFWEGGWQYRYARGYPDKPNPSEHWELSLAQAKTILTYLSSLQEEEVKQLFRRWSEMPEPRY